MLLYKGDKEYLKDLQHLRLINLHMGFNYLYACVIFNNNSNGDGWIILGLNQRIWCFDGGVLTLDGAKHQLRDQRRLRRRWSVSEGVSEWVEINICLLQHQNVICFSTELIKPDTEAPVSIRTTLFWYNRALFRLNHSLLWHVFSLKRSTLLCNTHTWSILSNREHRFVGNSWSHSS